MRRVSGFVLTLLGAFFLLAAVLLRFWIAPSAVKFPLDEYQVVTLTGTGSYYSPVQGKELNGVSVRITYTTRGDVPAGNGSTAVWDQFVSVRDVTNRQPISYVTIRQAFNRSNASLIQCCGVFVSNPTTGKPNHAVHMSGIGPVFPPNTQKTTYMLYDSTAARTEPVRYTGTTTVRGLKVYRFVETVSPTRFGTEQVPGSIVGEPSAAEVSLGEYYGGSQTFYVDPVTGGPLSTSQHAEVTLRDSTGATRLVGSNITAATTPASVQAVVTKDVSGRNAITLANDTLPLIGLIVGLLLLLGGILLVQFGGEAAEGEFSWLWRRQLNHYPSTGPRIMYLAITVLATVTLYYELYVGGSVSTLILVNLKVSFTFYVTTLAIGNLIGAFASLFAGLADRLGRVNMVVGGLFVTGIFVAYVLPAATDKWTFTFESFVVGIVEGIALVATPALIRDFSPQVGRATAMGFWTAGPVLGSLIVTAVATNTIPNVIPDSRFWTHEYHICGAVGLIVFVIALIGLRELSPALRDQLMVTMQDRVLIEARAKGINIETMLHNPWRQLLKADVVISAAAVALMLLIYYTAVGFGLIYLSTVFGFTTKDANGLLNWQWGFNVIAVILIGMVSDLVRVRKPFMVLGGVGGAIMTVVYLNQAGHHPGYYTLAVIVALLSLFLGIAYTPWMASFTETVEARNPALIATGLAIWGWVVRVVVFVAFLIIPHVITSVTPLVNYGTTVQTYEAKYGPSIAFAQSHPKVIAAAQKYKVQLANAQKFAPELAVLQAHMTLFEKLATYTNPATIPPKLVSQAIDAAGGGAKGLTILTTIQNNSGPIEGVIAVAPQLQALKPYAAQLTAASKVPSYVGPYMEAHGLAVEHAAADTPGQWKNWYWVCFGGIIFFLCCIPLLRGRWSPAQARRDEEAHEAATEAELAKLDA
jgi:MFS transporter, ACS family, D-galactonate transporter